MTANLGPDGINLDDQPLFDIPEDEPDASYGEWLEQAEGFLTPYTRPARETEERERE